jgi:hypothetical protein
MFDRGHAAMVETVDEERELEVVYTEYLKRGIAVKMENKLILGIGDENQKESA